MYDEKKDFIKHHHGYLNEYIKLADVKALGLITANGLILRLLLPSLSKNFDNPINLFSIIGSSFLVLSIIFSLNVVLPKTNKRVDEGLIFWENIKLMKKDEYIEQIKKISQDDLMTKLIEQNYFLALTAENKYSKLKRSFCVSFVGYIFLVMSFIVWLMIK